MCNTQHTKRIVKNCENYKDQGSFIGDLCVPCYKYISTGEGVYSQAYRNEWDRTLKYSEELTAALRITIDDHKRRWLSREMGIRCGS